MVVLVNWSGQDLDSKQLAELRVVVAIEAIL